MRQPVENINRLLVLFGTSSLRVYTSEYCHMSWQFLLTHEDVGMRERQILMAALQKQDSTERAIYLKEACADDPELLARVTALLDEHADAGSEASAHRLEATEAASSPEGNPLPCKRLGDFEIIREIGRGGMGIVYEAHQLSLNRKVALKVLSGGLGLSSTSVYRFRREAEAAAKLHHTNIVPIYSTGEADSSHYYAMEFVEGSPLDQLIRRMNRGDSLETPQGSVDSEEPGPRRIGPRDAAASAPTTSSQAATSPSTSGSEYFDDVAKMIADVADALDYAHQHGVVHRDIKPSNLIRGEDGIVRVMDFGLAKMLDEPGVTMSGDILGTPSYMSPEQIAAGRAGIDHRTDVYSLGATLYELLTLRPPHAGRTREQVIAMILSKEPMQVRRLNKKVPVDLETICLKALEKDPDQRYQTAAQMAEDLRRYVHRYAIHARRASLSTRFVKWVRRNKIAASVAPVILLLVVATAVTGFWYRAEHTAREAQKVTLEGERWARNAIPRLRELIAEQQLVEAFELAERVRQQIPDDLSLAELWLEVSEDLSISTEPSGASVSVKLTDDVEGEWMQLGETPLRRLMPSSHGIWRIEQDEFEPVTFLRATWDSFFSAPIALVPVSSHVERTVRVRPPKHGASMYGPGFPPSRIPMQEYLLDRYEVTNREFQEFVDQGGYENKKYWKVHFIRGGETVTWSQALSVFRDNSGHSGPRTWTQGRYPQGQGDHPVRGVSWYEAAAYAEFVGKGLPSIYEWNRASGIGLYSNYLANRSNLNRSTLDPVGVHESLGPFGTYDMAGNVKEWCWNNAGEGRRYALGGAWNEPKYSFQEAQAIDPFQRPLNCGFRCVKRVGDTKPHPSLLDEVVPAFRDYEKETPVSDEVFASYLSYYAYDKAEVMPQVVSQDESNREWRREEIVFRTGEDDDDPLAAAIFLPRNTKPPYQVVIYFPGANAIADLSKPKHPGFASFLVEEGRALLLPSYKSTYQRTKGLQASRPNLSVSYRDHVIAWGQEFQRCVDYLSSRPDIDAGKLGYLGFSWGAVMGTMLPAVERRLQASVLLHGGMNMEQMRSEVDKLHFLPRVKVPTLMINNRNDFVFDYHTSQLQAFRLLGVAEEHKRHVVYEGGGPGHWTPRSLVKQESLAWFDRYLGPVEGHP